MLLKHSASGIRSIFVLSIAIRLCTPSCQAIQGKRPFTVVDEIGLTLFDEYHENVRFSPNGKYFVLCSARGRLDTNRVEHTLLFYRARDVRSFLANSEQSNLRPLWSVTSGGLDGWRWLTDSSGVAFREPTGSGNMRLVLADLNRRLLEHLTSNAQNVDSFDFRDRQHYVYTVPDTTEQKKLRTDRKKSDFVGTGHSLFELIFPDKPIYKMLGKDTFTNLWAVAGRDHFVVKNQNLPLALAFDVFDKKVVLSPDGRFVVASLAVPDIPQTWETLYPSPSAADAYRIEAGKTIHQFVLISLKTGSVRSLTRAPISKDAGMWDGLGFAAASWSNDSKSVLLPGTFLESKKSLPSRPCIAVVDILSNKQSCVDKLSAIFSGSDIEQGHPIADVQFVAGNQNLVRVSFFDHLGEPSIWGSTTYQRTTNDRWDVVAHVDGSHNTPHDGLTVAIKQSLNEPPVLIATLEGHTKVLWDPNPQLKKVALGEASIYRWKDKEGRDVKGGLYKPNGYRPSVRYPLIIQTHGFVESEFRPSGVYPSGFAARALASAGFVVLQSPDAADCPYTTPREHMCAISIYESAVTQLVSEGLVDPERIGIIGFSHSGGYVLDELTAGSLHIKAALIEDADLVDYFRYMSEMDLGTWALKPQEFDATVGARPFGKGLQLWLNRTPSFNLDKISAPLRIVVHGPDTFLLGNWQPYAGLRYLHKPVDLILMNPANVTGVSISEHVLSSPALRMVSQGGSVDWFRFWLQGYEDPEPAKMEQYQRWRALKQMQKDNEP